MGDILVPLYEAANVFRIQREVQEAAEGKRKEEERQREARRGRYNLEVERTNALVNESRIMLLLLRSEHPYPQSSKKNN